MSEKYSSKESKPIFKTIEQKLIEESKPFTIKNVKSAHRDLLRTMHPDIVGHKNYEEDCKIVNAEYEEHIASSRMNNGVSMYRESKQSGQQTGNNQNPYKYSQKQKNSDQSKNSYKEPSSSNHKKNPDTSSYYNNNESKKAKTSNSKTPYYSNSYREDVAAEFANLRDFFKQTRENRQSEYEEQVYSSEKVTLLEFEDEGRLKILEKDLIAYLEYTVKTSYGGKKYMPEPKGIFKYFINLNSAKVGGLFGFVIGKKNREIFAKVETRMCLLIQKWLDNN